MSVAILAKDLTKIFKKTAGLFKAATQHRVINALNFSIEAGSAVAFLGANGAGKSTLIKLLCGILTPTSGQCSLFNQPCGTLQANRQLGLILGTRSQLWSNLTLQQSLIMTAEIYGITGQEQTRRITELVELWGLSDLLSQQTKSLSLGQRIRSEIASALIHHPRIVLADEPTIGLDAVVKSQFRDFMNHWRYEKKMTLLLTSHDCADIESLCERTILLEQGRIRYDGSLEELKGQQQYHRTLVITVSQKIKLPLELDQRLAIQPLDDYRVQLVVDTAAMSLVEAVQLLFLTMGSDILDIQIQSPSLETVIKILFTQGNRGTTSP